MISPSNESSIESSLPSDGPRSPGETGLSLAELPTGHRGQLESTQLNVQETELLQALGLAPGCDFRVCKQGEPCIVQVHQTRVGLPREVARRLFATPPSGLAS